MNNKGLLRLLEYPQLLSAALLFFIVIFLYGSSLSGWWRWDDPDHLLFVMQYSPWEYFFEPAIWQKISAAHLTPWLSLSYDIDFYLFKLKSTQYYFHYLVSLYIVALFTFFLLNLWLSRLWSLLGALLFIVGVPVVVVAHQLMSRHYVEGLIFAMTGLYCYVVSLRQSRKELSCLGAFFYLLAVCAKEVYVPLVGFLLLLRERNLKLRIKQATPYFLVVILYSIWRWHMLGTPVGGYVPLKAFFSSNFAFGETLSAFYNIPSYFFGKYFIGNHDIILLIFLILLVISVSFFGVLTLLFSLVLIFGPLLPLLVVPDSELTGRLLFLPWWALSIAIVIVLTRLASLKKWATPLCIGFYGLILSVVLQQSFQADVAIKSDVHKIESQGWFIWKHDGTHVLVLSPPFAMAPQSLGHLIAIKRKIHETAPLVVFDEILLKNFDQNKFSFWAYNVECQCIKNISEQIPDMLSEWNKKRVDNYLSVWAKYDHNVVSWKLGPYVNGKYSILGNNVGKYFLPREGQRRVDAHFGVFFIRYDSPEGWFTYSDCLSFDNEKNIIKWRR